MASDLLLPQLHSVRALALAASGKLDEANAVMSMVAADYPSFIAMPGAQLAVRLVRAIREGDLEAASRIAMGRTRDMPLSIRVDLLADLALAATTGVPEDEHERIDGELASDASLRDWVDAVAPGVRQRMHVEAAVGPRVAIPDRHEEEVMDDASEGLRAMHALPTGSLVSK